jgi:hypothetical protein
VRAAVLRKVLADHLSDPRALVMEELGLEHGACRVDIAVINGLIHGYELKSDLDTLIRLPNQVTVYSRALDKATLVVGEKHAASAEQLIPEWWGIKVSYAGPRGAVHIDNLRPATVNPTISPYHVAHLLWRNEAVEILESLDVEKKDLRASRVKLYGLLAELLPPDLLREHVRGALKRRTNWRHPSRPS